MKPHELVAALVRATGKPTLQVATEMHSATFQGTLHKFINGRVPSPSRTTAERIARYFDLPVDALYSVAVATRIAKALGHAGEAAGIGHLVREPAAAYDARPARPVRPLLNAALDARIAALDQQQLAGLISVVVAYLNAIAPSSTVRKRAS
jgi:DNA-binding XRE family transcriptional regulator